MARNYLRLAVGTFRVTEISRFHLAELNTDIPLAKEPLSIWILATGPTEFIRSSQLPNYTELQLQLDLNNDGNAVSTTLSSYQKKHEKSLEE